ncbi:SUEL-type lectin domain-containing protein [Plasmodiophora brassicae]
MHRVSSKSMAIVLILFSVALASDCPEPPRLPQSPPGPVPAPNPPPAPGLPANTNGIRMANVAASPPAPPAPTTDNSIRLRLTYTLDEGDKRTIRCPHGGKFTTLFWAGYGLQDPLPASQNFFRDRGCHSARSHDVVAQRCLNQAQCDLEANNGVFGDPCVGTRKTLSVAIECTMPATRSTTTTVEIKEGKKKTVTCANGGTISNVLAAIYGKPSKGCAATTSMDRVRQACPNGKQSCELFADNGVFGDPCVGTGKTLQVQLECASPTVTKMQKSFKVDEDQTTDVTCDDGELSVVVWAGYGRQVDRSDGLWDVDPKYKCDATSSRATVSDLCLNRSQCKLSASNGVFGDPCVGVRKTLAARFECTTFAS